MRRNEKKTKKANLGNMKSEWDVMNQSDRNNIKFL